VNHSPATRKRTPSTDRCASRPVEPRARVPDVGRPPPDEEALAAGRAVRRRRAAHPLVDDAARGRTHAHAIIAVGRCERFAAVDVDRDVAIDARGAEPSTRYTGVGELGEIRREAPGSCLFVRDAVQHFERVGRQLQFGRRQIFPEAALLRAQHPVDRGDASTVSGVEERPGRTAARSPAPGRSDRSGSPPRRSWRQGRSAGSA